MRARRHPAVPALAVTSIVLGLLWQGVGGAQASTGDALTFQGAGLEAGQPSTPYSVVIVSPDHGMTESVTGGQLVVRTTTNPTSVYFASPSAARFVAGTTYAAAGQASATTAQLSIFGGGTCPAAATTVSSSITVLAATYDVAGTLTSLAADFLTRCSNIAGTDWRSQGGSIRFNTPAVPYELVKAVAAGPPPTTARGQHNDIPVTVTAQGPGTATVTGLTLDPSGEFAVLSDGCTGLTLSDGQICPLVLRFAPSLATTAQGLEHGFVGLKIAGQPDGVAYGWLSGTAVLAPSVPAWVTSFPTAGGVGLAWGESSPNYGDTYTVERLDAGTWTSVASVAHTPNATAYSWVDPSIVVGDTAVYRVAGVRSGWMGAPTSQISVVRTAAVTPASSSSWAAQGGDSSHGSSAVSTLTGATFDTSPQSLTVAQAGQSVGSLRLGPLPGPGSYDLLAPGAGLSFDLQSVSPQHCATAIVHRLIVRKVLFAADLTPVVLDASVVAGCTDGTTQRYEIRLGSGTAVAFPFASPETPDPVSAHVGGPAVTTQFTITNRGPGPVDLGAPTFTGAHPQDWSLATSTCAGATLGSGASCALGLSFVAGAAGTGRDALLEVPTVVGGRAESPVVATLRGTGGEVPAAPYVSVARSLALIGVRWSAGVDGGFAITSYVLQRSVDGGAFADLGSFPPSSAGEHGGYVDTAVLPGQTIAYRVRAVNEIGAGAWGSPGFSPVGLLTQTLVEVAAPDATQPAGLYVREPENSGGAALEVDGYDHATPTVSPGAGSVAYSRSVALGLGGSEWDLWVRPLKANGASVRLTSLGGAETDPAWSPAGRSIAFTWWPTPLSAPSVMVVAAAGGTPVLLRANASRPSWTPDGLSIVVEDDTSATSPLLSVRVAGGAAVPVTGTNGGTDPALAKDGRIAFVDSEGNAALVSPGSATPSVLWQALEVWRPAWSPDGLRLDYAYSYTSGGGIPRLSYLELIGPHSGATISGSDVWDHADPAWAYVDTQAPLLTATGVASATANARVSFSATDALTAGGGLTFTCAVDAGPPVSCTSPWVSGPVTDGSHTVTVTVADPSGNVATAPAVSVVDRTAPALPTFTAPAGPATLSTAVAFVYGSTDAGSGIASFDVQYATGTAAGGIGPWVTPTGWTGRAATSVLVGMRPGREACVQVRAHDRAGNASAWSSRCVGMPFDDVSLIASTGWTRAQNAAYYSATATVAKSAGRVLTLNGAVAKRIVLVATACSTCGSVSVYLGTRLIGTVNLHSTALHYQSQFALPLLSVPTAGTLTIRTTTAGLVQIDGVMLRRT